jgi:hypothetical protein
VLRDNRMRTLMPGAWRAWLLWTIQTRAITAFDATTVVAGCGGFVEVRG